ncbi:aspartate aminotransferase family protein [Pseudomonas sp. ZM23]|uniref:Aspartate aminotransferase family protein n=1 Tax=Pseudomonas triclosanedens TaxID=2961893 RepID=A0ABY7A2Q2_9PSED|nr:aspartate aminotransferase family protein [Pseudomonas triclosanedens]MCP8464355.1 aspartate aminotransferase family protein [Pseudomonas triclosanedens]MCP8471489.1 aspartate aminotransferase family protein [Pseudomonas triclosanedens]MCP8477702.1 aspartate aminotransferase family protein [Pseudomonas triclosanedens]WAI51157.1 aspartate aminotransferase family protein [Pseudomonas triclosanedens]
MTMPNGFSQADADRLSDEERHLIERRERLLGPAYRLFYERPLHTVRGEGVWLYDKQGRRYLDAYNNVASIGHCHPRVVQAIASQAAVLNTHTRYLQEGILDYAEDLLGTFPTELSQVMFTCTGSEANDLALRIARQYTGGTGVIITRFAYHGVTGDISELSPALGSGITLPAHARTVRAPDAYRLGAENVAKALADDVRSAIADLRAHGIKPAALLLDGIFASDGVFPDPAGFLADAVKIAREEGLLYIADEVQCGFARTGLNMWGFQRHGVVPDLVTLGKPMGNGQPIAGVVARGDILESFGRNVRYFNTFGGNPVSCAAAQAVLDVIRDEHLQQRSQRIGELLLDGMRKLAERHELVGDVRGAGLFLGMELVTDRTAKTPAATQTRRVVNAMRERGVLISAAGPLENILKIRPLLAFEQEHAELFIDTLDQALGEVAG